MRGAGAGDGSGAGSEGGVGWGAGEGCGVVCFKSIKPFGIFEHHTSISIVHNAIAFHHLLLGSICPSEEKLLASGQCSPSRQILES